MSQRFRRFLGLMLVLTLVVGGAMQRVQASDMAVKMSTAATSGMTMPGDCNGCSGDSDGTPMMCFAICNGSLSAVLTFGVTFATTDESTPVAMLSSRMTGQRAPPDPYPPRPSNLS